jgi:hypothetical protein
VNWVVKANVYVVRPSPAAQSVAQFRLNNDIRRRDVAYGESYIMRPFLPLQIPQFTGKFMLKANRVTQNICYSLV